MSRRSPLPSTVRMRTGENAPDGARAATQPVHVIRTGADADFEHAPPARALETGELSDERLLRVALLFDGAKEREAIDCGDAARAARLGFPMRGHASFQRSADA